MAQDYQRFKEIREAIENDDPPPAEKHNPEIKDPLNSLILPGFQKHPRERFQTAYIDVEIARARELIKEKKEPEAETLLANVLQRSPNKGDAYLLPGEIHTRGLKPLQTEEILRKGIAQCPAHWLSGW